MRTIVAATAISALAAGGALADADSGPFPEITVADGQAYLASRLMGTRVHVSPEAPSPGEVLPEGGTAGFDDIGEIGDVVLSADGGLEAVIVDVGGFLGLGEREVALAWDALVPVTEEGDPGEVVLVVRATREALEAAPAFDRGAAEPAAPEAPAAPRAAPPGAGLDRPEIERDGFTALDPGAITAEDLEWMRVHGPGGEDMGEVGEVLVAADGTIEGVVLDIGGFLGLGEHEVAVTLDEILVLRGEAVTRVHVDATREQLEALPAWGG
ncbi:MAG: PRC-barrel domain-containing protein [Hasllibacter sp.]